VSTGHQTPVEKEREDQQIQACQLSSTFDEQHLREPERFEIERSPNRHQSFGHGIRFCTGAPPARLEALIALGVLVGRLPGDCPWSFMPRNLGRMCVN
jgi:cytochrome P450